jgi:hypothetical protein
MDIPLLILVVASMVFVYFLARRGPAIALAGGGVDCRTVCDSRALFGGGGFGAQENDERPKVVAAKSCSSTRREPPKFQTGDTTEISVSVTRSL